MIVLLINHFERAASIILASKYCECGCGCLVDRYGNLIEKQRFKLLKARR